VRLPETRVWAWSVWLVTIALVATLWMATAIDDAEWALWRHYSAPTVVMNITFSAVILGVGYVLSSGAGLARRTARVIALWGSAFATVVVLEIPAVIFGHDYGLTLGTHANDTWLQLAQGINRRDNELIHVHWPHSRFRGTTTGNLAWLGLPLRSRYDVDLKFDRNGFRNDSDVTKADLVAIGDSFVEGAETAQSKTVVAELARCLEITAVNLGQSGYGPQQELIVLKRYGLPLSPRVVVWFVFGGNDLTDVDAYESRRQRLDEFLAPQPVGGRLFSRNALTALARLTTPVRRTASALAERHEIRFTRADGTTELLYLDAHEGEWTPHQWEVTSATLLEARDLSASAGARFVAVFIPRKLRVYKGYIQANPRSFAHTWSSNNLPDVMAEFCRKHGISFLDSTVPLRRAVAAGESVYLPDDVHWNEVGHRVVAMAVADRLHETPTHTSGGVSR
jgi:lysophospholipase L1-like esterase